MCRLLIHCRLGDLRARRSRKKERGRAGKGERERGGVCKKQAREGEVTFHSLLSLSALNLYSEKEERKKRNGAPVSPLRMDDGDGPVLSGVLRSAPDVGAAREEEERCDECCWFSVRGNMPIMMAAGELSFFSLSLSPARHARSPFVSSKFACNA